MNLGSHHDEETHLTRARTWLLDHSHFGSVVGSILAVAAGALFCNEFLGERLIHSSYDLPLALRVAAPPKDIVILYMDEPSHENLNQDWDQLWDRNLHAQLLDRLKKEGSRTVLFDVLFSRGSRERDPSDSATKELARALKSHGRVVLASHLRREEGIAEGTSIEAPEEPLKQAAAGVGLS